MPRPIRPWFRFYVESFNDRKIRRLTPAQRWVWAAILGAARESPEPGKLLVAADLPMTRKELSEYADVKLRDVADALEAMQRMGMISEADGLLTVCNWGSRQYESDDVTRRTRDHRERSKERSKVVPGNIGRNAPETETETETEKPVSRTKRGTRLPDDWKPDAADVAWQREKGISDALARRELEKFHLFWPAKPGKEGTKLDWSRTWRSWLLRAQEQAPRAAQHQARPAGWEFGMGS